MSFPPAPELLSSSGAPQPAPRSSRARLLVLGAVAGAVLLGGATYAAADLLGGGGAQPEDVLPSSAFAMAKVDLDPAAGQKLAVYRLSRAFPKVEVDEEADVRDELLAKLFDEQDTLDWDEDVKPWIGQRAAIAALPGDEAPEVVAAVAHTDRTAATRALRKLQDEQEDVFFAFAEKADYVLLGDDQATVDRAARAEDVLADDKGFRTGTDLLDGDQIVTAWTDLAALWEALPAEARDAARKDGRFDAPKGVVAVGAHAAARHVEVVARAAGVDTGQPTGAAGTTPVSGDLQALPDTTVAALAVSGLGPALTEGYGELRRSVEAAGAGDLDELAGELGLKLPDDVRTLLGDQTLLALLDVSADADPRVGLRTRTPDAQRALGLATRLAERSGSGAVVRPAEGGIAVGLDAKAAAGVAGGGGLGRTDAFRDAVPEAGRAGYVGYVDLAKLVDTFAEGQDATDFRSLRSAGLSATGGPDGSVRLRITVRPRR